MFTVFCLSPRCDSVKGVQSEDMLLFILPLYPCMHVLTYVMDIWLSDETFPKYGSNLTLVNLSGRRLVEVIDLGRHASSLENVDTSLVSVDNSSSTFILAKQPDRKFACADVWLRQILRYINETGTNFCSA